ncbi:hypothetical protein RRG08_053234 [Elysia crispata]|uniref:Secreted protein n=1 Tax=Elysia crispata TaxID=231223 RepID=A0AAE1AN23_9GAST|nr:hypothetical protein RRG08_053234 [Elysia crispata]
MWRTIISLFRLWLISDTEIVNHSGSFSVAEAIFTQSPGVCSEVSLLCVGAPGTAHIVNFTCPYSLCCSGVRSSGSPDINAVTEFTVHGFRYNRTRFYDNPPRYSTIMVIVL